MPLLVAAYTLLPLRRRYAIDFHYFSAAFASAYFDTLMPLIFRRLLLTITIPKFRLF